MTRYPDISTPASLHTPADLRALASSDISPNNVQPRERAVPCMECREQTWNLAGYCLRHYRNPGVCNRRAA